MTFPAQAVGLLELPGPKTLAAALVIELVETWPSPDVIGWQTYANETATKSTATEGF